MPELRNLDACDLLDADHMAVKHLFVDYARRAAAGDPTDTERLSLAHRICDALTVHAQIEEEIFYPALRTALPRHGDLLDEAQAEHAEARQLIARIREAVAVDDELDELVADLNRAIEHHVKEERDELFPKARSAAGLDLMALATQLRDRQRALQGETAAAA